MRRDPSTRRKRRRSRIAGTHKDGEPRRGKKSRKDRERLSPTEVRKGKETREDNAARKEREARKENGMRANKDLRKEKDFGRDRKSRTDREPRKHNGRRHRGSHERRSRRKLPTCTELKRHNDSPEPSRRSCSPVAPSEPEKLDEAEKEQHKGDPVAERLKRCLELTAEKDIGPSDNEAMDEKLRHYIERMAKESEEYSSYSDSRDSETEDDPVRRYSDDLFAQRIKESGLQSQDTCNPALRRRSPDICESATMRQGKNEPPSIDGLNTRLQALLGSVT